MKAKTKVCKFCGVDFYPFNSLQKVCTPRCAIELSKQNQIRKENREWAREKKLRKERIKSHADWLKDLQKVFNAYIRERDRGKPCISCGTLKGQMHAGHYRSVGSAPHLRFDEENVHIQCATCNNHLHGNLLEYRKNLVAMLGEDKVREIEERNGSGKMSVPEIREEIDRYRKKTKELKSTTNRKILQE